MATQPASDLVVAVNGRIVGVVGGYRPAGSGFEFNGFVGDVYRPGANEVVLYEVTGAGETRELHPID